MLNSGDKQCECRVFDMERCCFRVRAEAAAVGLFCVRVSECPPSKLLLTCAHFILSKINTKTNHKLSGPEQY